MEYSLLRSMWNQEFGIPEPELTEMNLADQKGKVSDRSSPKMPDKRC
jgi:hypothetical protein